MIRNHAFAHDHEPQLLLSTQCLQHEGSPPAGQPAAADPTEHPHFRQAQ